MIALAAILGLPGASGAQTGTGTGSGNGTGVSGGIAGGVGGGVSGKVVGGIAGGLGKGVSGKIPTLAGSDDQDREAEARERAKEQTERDKEAKEREKEALERQRDRENQLYDAGQDALDEAKWDKAELRFDACAQLKGKKADAALYWEAYSQNKQGKRDAALATLKSLETTYPESRWLKEGKALEQSVRTSTGTQPDVNQGDCELKLLAINSLRNSDPERVVPLLEKLLQGTTCPGDRKQALFVLAQMASSSAQARQVLEKIARGQVNPDLQRKALEYLALFGGKDSRQTLEDIYKTSSDPDVKRQILRGFMVSGDRDRLFSLAQNEKEADLRHEAIRQLGVMGARSELWQLYQKETLADNKAQIIQAFFVSGAVDNELEIAKTEKDPALRRKAIRSLGLMGASRTGEALAGIYANDKDPDDRKEVINALFLENNAKALVDIARKETDPAMKKAIVSKLSIMHSKDATDYLLEILNK